MTPCKAVPAPILAIAVACLLLATMSSGCAGSATAVADEAADGTGSLYLDVHELGAGNVTAEAVAEAHQKDLAVQGEHGVSFEKYWVDETAGKVYCLAHAPDPRAVVDTHREAHGLLPDDVYAVSAGEEAAASGGRRLFLDVHHLGAGSVTADAVAQAHEKDLAVQGEHGVSFLQYWVDEATGTVVCLSEADAADDVTATHAAAHGLLPDEVLEVVQGE
jgi:hypothetical protein